MLSQSDRTSDGFVIANASQTIAVTAAETETAPEGRTPYVWSPNIMASRNATRTARLAMMSEADG